MCVVVCGRRENGTRARSFREPFQKTLDRIAHLARAVQGEDMVRIVEDDQLSSREMCDVNASV
jgi:hypothetical protein